MSNFINEMDKLIKLFDKLKDNPRFKETVDEQFIQNIDFLVNNYESMKNAIPGNFPDMLAAPYKDMISTMIQQLKDEFGDDIFNEKEETEKEEITFPEMNFENQKLSKEDQIKEIDNLLKNPELSEESINELLEKRLKLSN